MMVSLEDCDGASCCPGSVDGSRSHSFTETNVIYSERTQVGSVNLLCPPRTPFVIGVRWFSRLGLPGSTAQLYKAADRTEKVQPDVTQRNFWDSVDILRTPRKRTLIRACRLRTHNENAKRVCPVQVPDRLLMRP